jgi:hypothetical protein
LGQLFGFGRAAFCALVDRSCFGRAAFCALWSTFLLWACCLLPAWGNFPALGELPFARWSTVPALGELPSARLGQLFGFGRAAFCALVDRSCFSRAAFCPLGATFRLWIYFFPFRRFIHVIRMLLNILLISRRGPSSLSDNEGKSFSNSFSQYTVSFASLSAIFILFIKSSMLCALSASAIDAPIAVPERRIWLNKT